MKLTPPTIAVVTVSYGSEDVLGPFLASLPEASSEPTTIVIADNKAITGDRRVSQLARESGARYLPMASNRGYGHAINKAVESLPPEILWVVVSNPDVVIHPAAIDVLVHALEADASIAAIGPKILSTDGAVYPSARAVPTLTGGVGHALFSTLWPRNPWTQAYRTEAGADPRRRDAGWLSGAFFVARLSVLKELNGFDEDFFMYFEDVDLGYRIGKLGLRNVYEPAATVTHTGAHSTSIEAMNMLSAHHKSAKRFLCKQYSGPLLGPIRWSLSLGIDVRSWLVERRNRSTSRG